LHLDQVDIPGGIVIKLKRYDHSISLHIQGNQFSLHVLGGLEKFRIIMGSGIHERNTYQCENKHQYR
jgi:hypothetical protein